MRSVPRRRPAQDAGAQRRAARVQREPELPILQLQRSAGNAAVAQLMRNGGDGKTAEAGPSPSFLNSFTPLFRALLQKFETGEKLDRVDLDTLRELRAEAREQGLRTLVADCDDLIDRARMRGIVAAPEETAPPEEREQEEEKKPKEDRETVDAMISSIVTAVIKDRVKNSNDHLDNWRGGRHHKSVGGVSYTYYDLDDVLFTTEQAKAIEDAIKRAAKERGEMMDAQALWPTVVQLSHAGHSAQDIIAVLEIYAAPPSMFELFPYWFKQAQSASQPKREKEALAEDTEPVSLGPPPTEKKKRSPAENKETMAHFARMTGRGLKGPLSALERLARERGKLLALRRQYNTMPGAQFAGGEFDEFDTALATLRAMFNSLKDMVDKQDFGSVLDFDDTEIFDAVEAGYRAAAKVFSVADAGYKNVQLGEEATKFTGTAKPGDTKTTQTKRKGGSDGIWDEGFTDTEMASWLDGSTKRSMNGQAVGSCSSYLQVHKKKGGSGGTGTYFRGQMVFHISHGKKGSDDGCTVFFIHEDDGTITIVGVGSHDDAYSVAYSLDWRHPDWKDGTWKGNTLILKK